LSEALSDTASRRWYVTALLIGTTVLLFFGIFAIWANRQALNTNNWTDTSSKLLEDETIRDAVAVYLVDQLYANVDVAGELEQAAPPDFKGLAGPVSGVLRQGADRVAKRALATAQVQQAWEQANRAAHEQLMAVLEDRNTAVSTANGEVVLNLNVLVQRIANQLGLGSKLANKLPPQAGQLQILRSKQLSTAQTIANLIRKLAWILTLLVIAGYSLAVYLARGRRRETLRAVGLAFMITGVLVLLARSFVGSIVVNALATTEAAKPPAEHAWDIGTELLSGIAASTIVTGVGLVVAAWIGGPTRLAASLRRNAAPYLQHEPAISFGVVGAILLLLIIWAPVHSFRNPPFVLLYAVLMGIGVEMLRRETAREFAGEQLADPIGSAGEAFDRMKGAVSKGASSVGGAVSKMRSGGGEAPTQETRVDQLERLGALKEKGLLTDEEFETEKTAILKVE
jgi:hypothetical protein